MSEVTIAWIRNTMDINELMISENLLDEVLRNPEVEILGEAREIEYDADGNLAVVGEAEAIAH